MQTMLTGTGQRTCSNHEASGLTRRNAQRLHAYTSNVKGARARGAARTGLCCASGGAGTSASAHRWLSSARCISRPAGERQCGSSSEPVEEAVAAGEAELVPAAAMNGPSGRGGETCFGGEPPASLGVKSGRSGVAISWPCMRGLQCAGSHSVWAVMRAGAGSGL